jgi:glucose/arabinose dehydrogenase
MSTRNVRTWRRIVAVIAVAVTAAFVGAGTVLDPVDLNSASAASTGVSLKLLDVATADTPIGFVRHPDGSFYVIEQGGRLRPLVDGKLGDAVLDVSKEISSGGEQGLLGAAFSVDGDWLFTDSTDPDGDTHITSYPWAEGRPDTSKARVLLTVDQPYANHNGGAMVMDSTGTLWIGLGDGGSAGDPKGNGQNLKTLLGKIVRIVPTPTASEPYSIPTGNLSSTRGRPEIWGYGLRNPWRIEVDEPSKTVWIGDVGQNAREEVNAVAVTSTAPNFGWKLREGTRAYEGGKKRSGFVEPVLDYAHSSGGCSVTGGVVYHGTAIAGLGNAYLFGDYCDGKIRRVSKSALGGRYATTDTGLRLNSLSSFGTDATGEIYVASTTGTIARIVPG